MKRRMVLASKSPRRRELLEMLGAQFEVITSDCDENITGLAPRDLVRELALRKAEAVYERLNDPDAVVIGSDTIVTPDGVKALGKPRTSLAMRISAGRPASVRRCVRTRSARTSTEADASI